MYICFNKIKKAMRINRILMIEIGDDLFFDFKETAKAVGILRKDGELIAWVPKSALKDGDVDGEFWLPEEDFEKFQKSTKEYYAKKNMSNQ
jgi:hypothetical protein